MSGLETLALVAGGIGTAVQAMGTIASGNAAERAGIEAQKAQAFKSAQLREQANEARAAAQREGFEKEREGRIVQSQIQARAAASGGGADDPTIIHLGEEVAGRAEYQRLGAIWRGENQAAGLMDEATSADMTGQALLAEGRAKKSASNYAAIGTILSGAGGLFDKYSTGRRLDSYASRGIDPSQAVYR